MFLYRHGGRIILASKSKARTRRSRTVRRERIRASHAHPLVLLSPRVRAHLAGAQPVLAIIFSAAVTAALLAMALVPVLHVTSLILSTGGNNPSNDYVAYMGLISRILSGSYDWTSYFYDTMIGFHSLAIPMFARLLIIWTTHWNMYAELGLGLVLAALKLGLLFDALVLTRGGTRYERMAALVPLAALTFSVSQISDFGYGDAALPIGFTQLGLAIAVWSIARFGPTLQGSLLGAMGGVLASLSGGGGLAVWPAVGVALLLRRASPRSYLVVAVSAVVGLLPYIIFIGIQHHAAATGGGGLFDLSFLVAAVGWPLSQGFSVSTATTAGEFGLALAILGLILGAPIPGTWKQSVPALMLLMYAVVNMWLVSVGRGSGTSGLAPWYAMHFVPLWLGLVGLGYVLWIRSSDPRGALLAVYGGRLWSAALIALLTSLYLQSNITEADKAMYLYSRSPASASCLRHYGVAPTSCEGYVFQWGIGHPDYLQVIGSTLRRFHLSVFAPEEQWALQGDYALDSVHVFNAPGGMPVAWTWNGAPAPVSDYRHLTLTLPSPDVLSWQVTLPANLTSATFHSSYSFVGSAGHLQLSVWSGGRRRSLEVLRSPGDVILSLLPWRGHVALIRLAPLSMGPRQTIANLTYPVINAHILWSRPSGPVDAPGVHLTRSDLLVPLGQPHAWLSRGVRSSAPGTWDFTPQASLTWVRPLHACLSNFGDIVVDVANTTPNPVDPSVLGLTLYGPNGTAVGSAAIPLYADGVMHAYTFSLKTLQIPDGVILTGLAVSAAGTPSPADEQMSFGSLRFVRNIGPSTCR